MLLVIAIICYILYGFTYVTVQRALARGDELKPNNGNIGEIWVLNRIFKVGGYYLRRRFHC